MTIPDLTPRLWLAGMAMQGMIANPEFLADVASKTSDLGLLDFVAWSAWSHADAVMSKAGPPTDVSEMARTIQNLEQRTERLRTALIDVIWSIEREKHAAALALANEALTKDSEAANAK